MCVRYVNASAFADFRSPGQPRCGARTSPIVMAGIDDAGQVPEHIAPVAIRSRSPVRQFEGVTEALTLSSITGYVDLRHWELDDYSYWRVRRAAPERLPQPVSGIPESIS